VTQTMLHVDRARTRMPLACTVIAVLVWTVSAAICFAAWLLKTNDSGPDLQGTESMAVPQSKTSSVAEPRDRYATESSGRPGRKF